MAESGKDAQIPTDGEKVIPRALSDVEKNYELEQKKQDDLLQKRFAEMDDIEKSLKEITSTSTNEKPEMVNRVEKLSGMKKHLDGLMTEITDIIKQRQETHFRLMELEEKMVYDQKLIQEKVNNFDNEMKILEDQCRQYEEVLALKIEKPEETGDAVRVSFKRSGDDAVERDEAPFILLQVKDGTYAVPSHKPKIEGFSKLVEDLNSTKDLNQFISVVRDKFYPKKE